MIQLDLSILNQKGTPMFNSDLLANRPSPAIVGRIFIAIDAPFGIFRDTGSVWDQITSSGTFSGSLATGQVAFGSATNTISGTNNLFYDNTNGRLGIGTNAPLGNLVVSSGQTLLGQNTNTGQRLQVNGDAFIKGSNTTSATSALLVQNSAGTQQMILNNAGQAMFGINVSTVGVRLETDGVFRAWTSVQLGQFGSAILNTTSLSKNAGGSDFFEFFNTTGHSAPDGTYYFLQLRNTVNPTSGIAIVNGLNLNFTINQTGGANGITRGLYVNPTLTSAADWRAIEWSNNSGFGLYGEGTALNYLGGSLGVKTTAHYAPNTFSVDINGGLLIKNTAGTTAQITLINADPSIGGNNGFLVASVGGTSGGSYVEFQGYYGTSVVGSTALRLNPAGGNVVINATSNSGEQLQLTGSIRVNGQLSGTAGGNSGQHLIINCDGTIYKIRLENN